MIRPSEAPSLLDHRPLVRLHSAADHSETIGVGRMVAFSRFPMVCIEMADGRRKWWVAAIAEVLDECPTCSWPSRETTGLVCQTCGADYGNQR